MQSAGVSWSDIGNWIEHGSEHDEGKYTESELQEYGQALRAEGVEAGIKVGMARKSNGGAGVLPSTAVDGGILPSAARRLKSDAQREFVTKCSCDHAATRTNLSLANWEFGEAFTSNRREDLMGAQILEPDRDQIEIFVHAIFRHAKAGVVSLRSFYEGEDKVFRIESVPTNATNFHKYLCDVAEDIAHRAAQDPKPVVFCPPLCTFQNKKGAGEADLAEGYTLSVECDENPEAARAKLEPLLGPVTVAVRSGGIWQSNGGAHDKVHLHWRLREPARGKEQLAKLKRAARDRLSSGRRRPDHRAGLPSAALAGLVAPQGRAAAVRDHRRGVDFDHEIDLDAALAKLEPLAPPPVPADANGAAGPSADWDEHVGNILRGQLLHKSITELAMKLVVSGMGGRAAGNHLRTLMRHSQAPRDERWQNRFDYIPRAVSSARKKLADEAVEAARLAAEAAAQAAGGRRQWAARASRSRDRDPEDSAAAELAIGWCAAGAAAAADSESPAADHPADRGRVAARRRRGRGSAARRYRQATALPARRAGGAPGPAETARRRHAGPQARDLRLAAHAGHQALHDRDLHPGRALRTLERPQEGLDGEELSGLGGRNLPGARRALEDSGAAAHRQCPVPARRWLALRAPGIRSRQRPALYRESRAELSSHPGGTDAGTGARGAGLSR